MIRDDVEAPDIPAEVAMAFAAFPVPVHRKLFEVRRLIFATATETAGVGPLTETLKWGEPAYLTEATGSGSTIRLGRTKSPEGACAVLFNCRTTLVETFRTAFPTAFGYEGNRAIRLDPFLPLPAELLATCIVMALTYRRGRPGTPAITPRRDPPTGE